MSVSTISSLSIVGAPRSTVERARRDLVNAQLEVSTGRHADVGLALGSSVRETLLARTQLTDLDGLRQSTELVAGRLEVSQSALGSINKDATKLQDYLVAARSSIVGQQTVTNEAAGFFETFRDLSNTTYNGASVFGGLNTLAAPIADYFSQPQSAARTAVQDAFTAHFGFASTDPKVANITPDKLSAFVSGPLTDIISGLSWSNFSTASSTNLKDRISSTEVVESSANANAQPFRDIAKAYIMISDLGAGKMSQGAFEVLADAATNSLSVGISGVGVVQSNLGFVQERVSSAQIVSSAATNLLQKHVNSLESVDPYEAATNLNSITTQLETAYSITARIQKLSILNYL